MIPSHTGGVQRKSFVLLLMISLATMQFACPPLVVGSDTSQQAAMLSMLQQRVAKDPNHADSWRLIGRLEGQRGHTQQAADALTQALRLDPEHVATHHDLGQLMLALGNTEVAAHHFQQVVLLAPKSSYAGQLRAGGQVAATAGAPAMAGNVSPVGYEIQTFDGSDDLDRRMDQLQSDADPTLKRWRLFLEAGALYNSNVSLTPISRELANGGAESYQGFLTPELEWSAWQRNGWRLGPLGRGYFSVNEQQASDFDLASFQPGGFLEREFTAGGNELIGRLDYVYALDLLGGDRFGDRHSVTASLIKIRPDLDVIYGYVTTSFSDFADDGADPTISSLDGTAVSGGISRFFQTQWSRMPTWSAGLDMEYADTEGADFRYTALTFHADATFRLSKRLQFLPEVGVGGRDYPDFTGAVNRDEVTWRVGGKLRWQCNDHFAVSIVAGHDRFASDNDEFDAERTQGGVVSTWLY